MKFIQGMNIKGGEMGLEATANPVWGTNYRTLSEPEIDILHTALRPTGYRVLVSPEAFAGSKPSHADYRKRWLDVVAKLCSLRVDGVPVDVLVEPHGGSSECFAAWQGRRLIDAPQSSGDEIEYGRALLRIRTDCASIDKADAPQIRFGIANEPPGESADWAPIAARLCPPFTDRLRYVVSMGNWSAAQTFSIKQAPHVAKIDRDTILEVHSYADVDRSGRSPIPASSDVLYQDLASVAQSMRTLRREWLVGEVGVSLTDSRSAQVFLLGMLAMQSARPQCRGWYWWGYGASPWYDSTLGSVTPANVNALPKWLVLAFRTQTQPTVSDDLGHWISGELTELAKQLTQQIISGL